MTNPTKVLISLGINDRIYPQYARVEYDSENEADYCGACKVLLPYKPERFCVCGCILVAPEVAEKDDPEAYAHCQTMFAESLKDAEERFALFIEKLSVREAGVGRHVKP